MCPDRLHKLTESSQPSSTQDVTEVSIHFECVMSINIHIEISPSPSPSPSVPLPPPPLPLCSSFSSLPPSQLSHVSQILTVPFSFLPIDVSFEPLLTWQVLQDRLIHMCQQQEIENILHKKIILNCYPVPSVHEHDHIRKYVIRKGCYHYVQLFQNIYME